MPYPRFFVEEISNVEPDVKTGLVKLTFSIKDNGKPSPEVQIVMHVDALNQAFQTVGEKMQKTFGQGGRRPGGRPPNQDMKKGGPVKMPNDLTER